MAKTSRRHILKLMGLTGVGLSFPGCQNLVKQKSEILTSRPTFRFEDRGRDISPINRNFVLGERSGHDFRRVHHIFSGRYKSYCDTLASGSREQFPFVPLVIVGGGISGLATAYLMRDTESVILESQARFGGVSQGESWRGLDYATGATYFSWPEVTTPLGQLYHDLGLHSRITIRKNEDSVLASKTIYKSFWNGDTDPKNRGAFRALRRHFLDVAFGKNGAFYPELPTRDPEMLNQMRALDHLTFYEYIQSFLKTNGFGPHIHPHILTVLQHYSWSALGASMSEVSALAGLNFYAAEFSDIAVLPGGNAAIAETFMERIQAESPRGNKTFQAESVVFDVRPHGDHVLVSYEARDGSLQTLRARSAVLACPKFACQHLLKGSLLEDRKALIQDTNYSSYVMTNVLLNKRTTAQVYDLFILGEVNRHDPKYRSQSKRGSSFPRYLNDSEIEVTQHGVTDIIIGSYSNRDAACDVVTLCQPLPSQKPTGTWGASTHALLAGHNPAFSNHAHRQFENEIAPALGIDMKNVIDLRSCIWGHTLPVARPGLLKENRPQRLSAPIANRIFFVEQDNWQLPCIESALTEALAWAPRIREVLAL